ncbi:lytic murein transglycosylase, partial [Halomonas litopenaei]|nr:lytic murein transglycosylase [Halomonas litopenaei]
MHRRHFIATGLSALALPQMASANATGFPNWIAGFRSRARNAGISDRTFDAAFANVSYLPDSIERDRNQAEFVRPLADYMASAVSETRVTTGREMVRRYANVLAQ